MTKHYIISFQTKLFFVVSLIACGWISCGPTEPQQELVILTEGTSQTEQVPTEPSQERPLDSSSVMDERAEPPSPDEKDASLSKESDMTVEPSMEPLPEKSIPELPKEAPPEPRKPDPIKPGAQWIGESCLKDSDCNYDGGRCLTVNKGYPDGFCTKDCTDHCPDKSGKPVTFCTANASGQGHCVSQCNKVACRKSYSCQLRQRINQATVLKNVCVPQSSTPGKKVTFLYIGDSQSSGSQFAKLMVDTLRNPSSYCSPNKTASNTVFSYAKVSSASRHWSETTGSSKNWLCGATKVYTNGTASSNTTGSALCSGIKSQSVSIFQKLIAKHKPNAFVIQLGGNSGGFSQTYMKARIKRMLDQMPSNSLCFWITPSYGTKSITNRRNVEKWTKEEIAKYTRIKCSVHTSIDEMSKQTTCSSFNSSDGVHMTSCGSKLWGQLITQKMCATGKL